MSRQHPTDRESKRPQPARWNWRATRPEWIAAAAVLLALAWMVTEGSWDFYENSGRLEAFFEAQANSFLAGHVDVAPDAIGDEAFVRNGKAYGYFGPTPALFRLPLVILFPGMNGHWSRTSMLLGSAVMLASVLFLIFRLEQLLPGLARAPSWTWLRTGLVLAAGIGSTQIFVCAESKVYQESIEWATSLSLASAVCLLSYVMTRRLPWLTATCVTAFLSFFSRVSSGAGPIFGLLLLDLAMLLPYARLKEWLGAEALDRAPRAIAMLSATIALTVALWSGLNYWKFGSFFASQPVRLNALFDAQRLRNIKGELASPSNIPLTLSTYLSPANFGFTPGFPWVKTIVVSSDALRARFPSAHFDYCEWFAALPDSTPALFFGGLGGAILLCFGAAGKKVRELRAPLLAGAAGCGLVFLWGAIAYRYLHDVLPFLVIGTAVALTWIATREDFRLRQGLSALFLAATAWSMWANFAFGLEHQRLNTWPIQPEKRIAFLDLSNSTAVGGPTSLLPYLTHWRGYVSAARVVSQQNLAAIPVGRVDWPVVTSAGAPPYSATYQMNVPDEGAYELAIRYAAAQPRPVIVSVNGQPVGRACERPTGGDSALYQRWGLAGRLRLSRGPLQIALSSDQPFPVLSFLRLVRLD
jgi:hypothetical protein